MFLNRIRIEVVEGGLELLFREAILSDRFKGTAATCVQAAPLRSRLRTPDGRNPAHPGPFRRIGRPLHGRVHRRAISRLRRVVNSFFHSPNRGRSGEVPCEIRQWWVVCCQALDRLPNPAMQPCAPRTGQFVIEGLPNQGVHKAASVAAPCSLPDQLRAKPFINYIQEAVFGHAAQVLSRVRSNSCPITAASPRTWLQSSLSRPNR